ncbi:MAG: hypothetical protein N2487_05210 [Verrucomicrobiae bacterium]|nr:hypothetical protein [Verrucomicrobiae bacterium]
MAKEMERQGFNLPLLIGGATTSKLHTAVKIAPCYRNPVVYVPDASRVSPVLNNLLNPNTRHEFASQIKVDYEKIRQQYQSSQQKLLTIEESRKRAPKLDYSDIPRPAFIGLKRLTTDPRNAGSNSIKITISELAQYIDWSPFFHAWEMRGRYPTIFENEKYGKEAKKLFDDACLMLRQIEEQNLIIAKGVYGFFPANTVGDDIVVYTDENKSQILCKFYFLRQQMEKPQDQPNMCLADFVAPQTSGLIDYIGAFAVTAGHGVKELVEKFKAEHDDYKAILIEALADRLAEAFAEYLHKRARADWGYGKGENLTNDDLVKEKYRGIRPAFGYPACPDHSEKFTLWNLLDVEKNAEIKLTPSAAMLPAASVSGLYFAHPQAKYFAIGKIGKDQLIDYHKRKGLPLEEIERWLAPVIKEEK